MAKKYTIASFFGGVGGIDLGFKQTEKFDTIYINEFDKNAQETIALNYPDVPLDRRDIHAVSADEVPATDVIVGGFPCQAFSIAGYRKGFEDDRGNLFFEMLRFIKHHQPRTIFIENVKNLMSHDNGNTFKVIRENLTMSGYFVKWKVLNAKEYGNIPQNRERIYVVGFRSKSAFDAFEFPEAIKMKTTLKDVIKFDENVSDEFAYQKGKQSFYDQLAEVVTDENTVYQWRRQYVRENKSGVVPTLTANMGTGGHNVPIIKTPFGIRKLTPRETFSVQGFPLDFKLPEISRGQLYKQAGNSVVVPVIKRIAEQISKAISADGLTDNSISADKNFALLYTKLNDRYSGESYLADAFVSADEAKKAAEFPLLTSDEYVKIIKRGASAEFNTIEAV